MAIVLVAWSADRPIGQEQAKATEYTQGQYGPTEGHWLPEFSARDTYAQWIVALLSIIATGVSVWAVRLVRDTLLETRRAVLSAEAANAINREIGEAQARAYLRIDSVAVRFAPNRRNRAIEVTIRIQNSGSSPAIAVGGHVKLTRGDTVVQFGFVSPDVPPGGTATAVGISPYVVRVAEEGGPYPVMVNGDQVHVDVAVLASDVFGWEAFAWSHFSGNYERGMSGNPVDISENKTQLGFKWIEGRLEAARQNFNPGIRRTPPKRRDAERTGS